MSDDGMDAMFGAPQIRTDADGRHWDEQGREQELVDVDGEATWVPIDTVGQIEEARTAARELAAELQLRSATAAVMQWRHNMDVALVVHPRLGLGHARHEAYLVITAWAEQTDDATLAAVVRAVVAAASEWSPR